MYQPYTYQEINNSQMRGQPNMIYLDSAIYDYYWRMLFNRLTSIFEFTVPKSWQGRNKNFFLALLFSRGFVGIVDGGEKFGAIFQPCTFNADRNICYQPTGFIVTNPYSAEISHEYTCGVDGELLQLTPDYIGVTDIVDHFACRLAFLATGVNSSLIAARNFRILGSRNRSGAAALKVVMDKAISGDPFCILDTKILFPDAKSQEDCLIDLPAPSAKENYITNMLLADEKTILKEFDECVGIVNVEDKAERLVTSEAEAQIQNSTASCFVWLDCLKDSIENIKAVFPGIELDVRMRFGSDSTGEEQTTNDKEKGVSEDVSDGSDVKRN